MPYLGIKKALVGHLKKHGPPKLAPMAETGFSHRLTAYEIVAHFFGLSYRKIAGSNQVKNGFF